MTTDTKIAEELRNLYSAIAPAMWSGESEECVLDKADAALIDRAAARIEALEAESGTKSDMLRTTGRKVGERDETISIQHAEITRLRALVESAYRDAELLRSALQGIIDTDNHLHEGGEETRLFRADEQAARNALAGIGDYKGAHRDTCVKALAEFVGFHARGLAVPNRLWKQAADALGRLGRAT